MKFVSISERKYDQMKLYEVNQPQPGYCCPTFMRIYTRTESNDGQQTGIKTGGGGDTSRIFVIPHDTLFSDTTINHFPFYVHLTAKSMTHFRRGGKTHLYPFKP